MRLAIISDVHYAGPGERERVDYPYWGVESALRRFLTRQYRNHIWQRDPFAHNYLLHRFIEGAAGADLVVANGDFSCDSAGIGVSDEASFESAAECLGHLRGAFGGKFRGVVGDHELGKLMMSSGRGGLRLASHARTTSGLELEPFWRMEAGNYVLLGITSTLVALPIYEREWLPEERVRWQELRAEHLHEINRAFDGLRPEQRVLLFCHDPSALPFLWREPGVRSRLAQLERTILGHLHTQLVYALSRCLSGMPEIHFAGHTALRLSRALREARHWRAFKPLLCPSPCGCELLKDGGYFVADLDEEATRPARFQFHRLSWS
jgi:3',5'-cyclic AMP phosphodiesterase CpdA